MNFKKLCSLSIVVALCLIVILSFSRNMSVSAVYRYGYKTGDVYNFNMSSSSTATTEDGTSTQSQSYAVTYKIEDINENTGGYRLNISYLAVTASGSMGSSMIQEGNMEGDPQPFTSSYSYPYMGMPSVFVTTDWDKRGDEWKAYVAILSTNLGWMVQDRTDSNGVFTVTIKFDVSKTQSHVDFDDDGTNDAYTGTMTERIEYNSNGVLSAYSMQTNVKFNDKNSFASSITANQGSPPFSMDAMLMYIVIGVVSFVVALVIGFFIGKSRKPKTAALYPSGTDASAPPPPPR